MHNENYGEGQKPKIGRLVRRKMTAKKYELDKGFQGTATGAR